MPKPRTKRQAIRDERKKKRRETHETNYEANQEERQSKRRRVEDEEGQEGEQPSYGGGEGEEQQQHSSTFHGNGPEREFFGMLADEEQEYFRRADELLELNQFPSPEERDVFLQNIYKEAKGKELKLASSQSLSRLMERLILLSNTKQKKQIFNAFATHFLSLVQHRFASHCCESLFLQSAPVVTQELGGLVPEEKTEDDAEGEEGAEPESTMEDLFLMTLDEFEQHMGFLLTDRFGSHTLRVLLVVLSGRPLEDSATKSLLKSKKKERISVQGAATASEDLHNQLRAVPESFTLATKKIIQDAVAGMDFTALRVLAKHPTGNPLLQLLLELDISLNHKSDKSSAEANKDTLLYRLLPDAPKSLSDSTSLASEFISSMVYDQIGSRLLETLITHCPGKIFKALSHNFFGERIATYVRNDIASYPALRVLNRFSKDDLVEAVKKILPAVPTLVSKARYNVLKTLFERCEARGAYEEKSALTKALTDALGGNPKDLVPKLCHLVEEEESADKEEFQQSPQNKNAVAAHGAHLVATMLKTPGNATKVAQKSLMALPADLLVQLATRSMATVNVLQTALAAPAAPQNEIFHRVLVAALAPHVAELAQSQNGHNVVNAIVEIPSRGKDRAVPFHVKQTIMATLGDHEPTLRDSWMGRSVWRTWKGDMWKTRRSDWSRWIKEVDGPAEEAKLKPWERRKLEQQQKGQQPRPQPREKKEAAVEQDGE
ncbi:putative pumilio-family RNA binding repeat domain-containing protein [Colletotrichum plurivorum]|uniref:Nucleolar protein 9 n=1 Tax=Colletotrichum plurivorum TaxID=2175906 RepID=A0A8H6KAU4_9PEZI|nr:putative pumilio-family RNA binding repeat domain-containing protein [Colletotrichum plurivorum]